MEEETTSRDWFQVAGNDEVLMIFQFGPERSSTCHSVVVRANKELVTSVNVEASTTPAIKKK